MGLVLIDGQGNFGSVDNDPPAAMRYTESRMTKAAEALLADLDKDTVDFQGNYDESEKEPVVLPSRIPNLLVNGSGGIAVGMATNIPPHNLGEVVDACLAMIDNPAVTLEELLDIVPGPDFPTGAQIIGRTGARQALMTGRGSVIMRSVSTVETIRKDREAIVVTEIPYQVNKAALQERIAELVREKRIEGVSDIRDESDRDGMRVVIELKRDAPADVRSEPALPLHGAANLVRRQHAGAGSRAALADGPSPDAGHLPRPPRGGGGPPRQVRAEQGAQPRSRPGRPRHRRGEHRRGDPHHPLLRQPTGGAGTVAGARLAGGRHGGPDRADPGPAHRRH